MGQTLRGTQHLGKADLPELGMGCSPCQRHLTSQNTPFPKAPCSPMQPHLEDVAVVAEEDEVSLVVERHHAPPLERGVLREMAGGREKVRGSWQWSAAIMCSRPPRMRPANLGWKAKQPAFFQNARAPT